ncbi:MAG TPA: FAD-binding oxidoreductase [Amnibacterium sp.]|uniref:NAD(P)/FAD-dependent oxidoreductase n=1 Tax=Amnibacterium sp. TaxID=1872496 RepID=UPI002F92C9C7
MTTTADIAIIGGGIAGFSLASAIGGRARTVLLEAEPELFHHTSSRSAEQMQPTYGPAPVRRLTSASIPRVQAIAEGLGRPIFTPRPLLWVGTTPDRHHLDELLATVLGLEEIEPREAVALLPALRPDAVHAAGIDRSAVEVDVPALLEAYRAAAVAGGVEVLPSSRVERAERIGDAWRLTAGTAVVEAPVVVNAAGAWVERIAALFGARSRGLQPLRRTVAVAVPTGRPVDPAWPMASDVLDTFYFRPRGRAVLASALEDEPSEPEDAQPRAEVVATVLDRVNAATDLALRETETTWTGLRTLAPDSLPVVGRDADVPGFYWLAGQGGYGIQTSAALGAAVADDLLGTASTIPGLEGVLADLSPARDALPA